MAFVSVPVTRFSRKIILREYGAEPIKVKRTHPLWIFLRPHAPGDHAGSGHISADRCVHVNIEITFKMRQVLRQNLNDAGLSLHRYHVEWMLRFCWANTINGVPALRALKAFYELYDIDDADYDLGSAFRMWQRFKEWIDAQFDGKTINFRRVDVLKFCNPGDDYSNPYTDTDLDEIAEAICDRVRINLNIPEYTMKRITIWVWYKVGERSIATIANRFHYHERSIYKAISQIRSFRKLYPSFKNMTDYPYEAEPDDFQRPNVMPDFAGIFVEN